MIELLTIWMTLQIDLYRLENNLPVAVRSEQTCDYAEKRLGVIRTDWSHDGFRKDLKAAKGYWYENLGKVIYSRGDFPWNTNAVLEHWKKSPLHNSLLLSDMEEMCIKLDGDYFVLTGYGK